MRPGQSCLSQLTTSWFSATPPIRTVLPSSGRPLSSVPSTVRVMPRHRPDHMSIRLQPSCWRWMRSLFANTVQRVAMVGGLGIVQVAPGVVVGDAQTARLLVEERAGAGGAQRIGRVALELALAVELDERGRPAADVHHGEGIRRHPADGVNLAKRHVAVGHLQLRREQFGVAAREPDRRRPAGRSGGPAPPTARRPARRGAARRRSRQSGQRRPAGRP